MNMNPFTKRGAKGLKLDIAGGKSKGPGFIGIDEVSRDGVDEVVDLGSYPWTQFADNSASEIVINHYMERVVDLSAFMDEVWRIAEDGAKVTIISSYYTSVRAWADPFTKRAISEATFPFFNKIWRKDNGLESRLIRCDFDMVNYALFFNEPWNQKSEEAKQFAIKHYWNVVADFLVELKVKKI